MSLFFKYFLSTGIAVIFAIGSIAYAGTLSCSVTTAAACTGTVIWRMSGATNAHAELPSQSTAAYASNVVCCSGVTGLGTSCAGTFATALKLSGTTNAHTQQTGTYAQSACISVPSGGSVSVGYQSTNCTSPTAYDTTLGSMSAADNAHVGDGTAYTTKICGTAAGASASLTFTVSTDTFPALTPGSPVFATSTLSIDTNNTTGWNVTVSRDDPDTTIDLDTDATVNIIDQTAWSPGAATTTAGNAVRVSSLANSQKVLAFRVMTASGTASFVSSTWWGTTDAYIDSATSLWAGFNSTAKKVGDSSISCSGTNCARNTVLYYLDVASTQKTGAYSGGITYTATMNP
ncbi:MAG: hypothetical protein HY980_00155 [Candidatus Magasanikbacteria bacterium]|nr:hypothetical protein [Candidatus Magasanikbacteria bacterium]